MSISISLLNIAKNETVDIARGVCGHSPRCVWTKPEVCVDIARGVCGHSPRYVWT